MHQWHGWSNTRCAGCLARSNRKNVKSPCNSLPSFTTAPNLWGTPYSETHNSLVLDKSLFCSLPVLQYVLFSLFSRKKVLHNHLSPTTIFTNIVILAVSYERCHPVTTLPFTTLLERRYSPFTIEERERIGEMENSHGRAHSYFRINV